MSLLCLKCISQPQMCLCATWWVLNIYSDSYAKLFKLLNVYTILINFSFFLFFQYSSRDVIQYPQCVNTFKNDWVRKKNNSWFQWNLPYIYISIYNYIFFLFVNSYSPLYTPISLTYNHASASTTMDRVSAVPNLHTNIWGDCSTAHQLGVWTHSLQDVPEQAAPKGLSLWPDSYQHRHWAVTCQHCPVAACGRPGKTHLEFFWHYLTNSCTETLVHIICGEPLLLLTCG